MSRDSLRRSGLRVGLGLGLTVALTVGGTLSASAQPRGMDRTPSAAAAAAGVTAAGGGYMGWASHGQLSRTSQSGPDLSRTTLSGTTVPGIDVSSYNYPVHWDRWWNRGKRFAYIKATEGTSYRNPHFGTQYYYSYKQGFIRGAYHFARPDGAAGWQQAKYFVAHGGRWSGDGKTLPGALDLEQNYTSSKHPCWGNSDSANVAWAKSFLNEYKKLTGRNAVIYTNMSFWKRCMGNTYAFRYTNPLWFAYYGTPTSVPGGWPFYTFLQYSGTGTDKDRFTNSMTRLKALALNK